jgi:transposase
MSKFKSKDAVLEKGAVKRITKMPVINPLVAGVDVSDKEMMVAYPINEDQIVIQAFDTFTADLKSLVTCLKEHGIKSVAMESTGVYGVTLLMMLQEEGIEVFLVNAQHTKNVTGRKTDESDAEWIQKLHSCGLLSASFQPDNFTRALRSTVRHLDTLKQLRSACINRMQKAYELMNIKLHTVISDIDGVTGLRITEAVLAGERDPKVLAKLRDGRIKASEDVICKSLEGYWKDEHLFELRQCYESYKFNQKQINECEEVIKQRLEELIAYNHDGVMPDLKVETRKTSTKGKFSFDLSSMLYSLLGVDITRVFGISELTALKIIAETGTDMSKWPTHRHFASWLGFAPNTKISGNKLISSRIKKKKHYAGQAFRMAASGLTNNKSYMGDFYRRVRGRAGAPKAVVATARKLSVIFYHMLLKKESFNPRAYLDYQEKNKLKQIEYLRRKIEKLEAQVVAA